MTMGIQMMNNPFFADPDGDHDDEVNALIGTDMFVVTKKDIKEGEEILTKYNHNDGEEEGDMSV